MMRFVVTAAFAFFLFLAVALWIAVLVKFAEGNPNGFWSELKSWQILIGGFLGFFFGSLLNHYLQIRRDNRRRKQEARAMASALSAEIDCLKVEVDANRELYAEGTKDRLTLNREILRSLVLPTPTIFDSVAPRLGLFPTELTLMVVSVYGAFAATGHKLTTAAAIKGDITLDPDDEGDQGLLDAFAAAVVLAKQTEKGLKAFAAGNWTPPAKAEDDA